MPVSDGAHDSRRHHPGHRLETEQRHHAQHPQRDFADDDAVAKVADR
jgi:hypothetical protein